MTDTPLDPAMNPDFPPIGTGDWVASNPGDPFQVARVKAAYFDQRQGWLMDLSIYHPEGRRIGRESPRMGGPSSFEPAIAFKNGWRRIERPNFPLQEKNDGVPYQGSDGRWHTPLRYSFHQSVMTIPVRGRPVAVAAKAPVEPAAAQPGNYDPRIEAAARRLAAQSLRDVWRTIDRIKAGSTKDRIELEFRRLEREAEAFQAEHDAAVKASKPPRIDPRAVRSGRRG